jgi:DNA repair exonuclease SbcCD nuclease subunit
MVKIVHLADSHLGYRARRGVINKWAIENYSKPYEQEIYDTFLRVLNEISKLKDLDFVIHCGDMFHLPSEYSSYPPPEPARRTLQEGLNLFFKNTNNQVPFIYIEGNHGVFKGYDFTPFESHFEKEKYSNLYYFKERDLINAINSNSPLSLEFNDKKVRFYLFPYFEFNAQESYTNAYDNWIEQQKPPKNDNYINVALAHGSNGDNTLHNKVNSDDFGYDYVALGHEHGLKAVSKNHFYTGSLLPMNFKEVYENQGYLIVDIDDKSKKINITKVFTNLLLNRRFEAVSIETNPNQTSKDLEILIMNELTACITKEGFDYKTSARLKFNFIGEITFEKNWQINELMSRIRRETFSQSEKYNILQIIWKISDVSERLEDDISAGIIEDFILEKPDEEFRNFVNEKLTEDKTHYDINKLTNFGMHAIKKALRVMEKQPEE